MCACVLFMVCRVMSNDVLVCLFCVCVFCVFKMCLLDL